MSAISDDKEGWDASVLCVVPASKCDNWTDPQSGFHGIAAWSCKFMCELMP